MQMSIDAYVWLCIFVYLYVLVNVCMWLCECMFVCCDRLCFETDFTIDNDKIEVWREKAEWFKISMFHKRIVKKGKVSARITSITSLIS